MWGNDIYGTPNYTTSYPMDVKPFIEIYKAQVGNASGLTSKAERMRAEFA